MRTVWEKEIDTDENEIRGHRGILRSSGEGLELILAKRG
jgi:hypothetical protein